MKYFKAYKADGTRIPTYFIESTAPDNVDDTENIDDTDKEMPSEVRAKLKHFKDSDDAVKEIADVLANGANPNLVVMVHGFNNPEPAVLKMYTAAAEAIQRDDKIPGEQGLVCVGYRWPSEKMGAPAPASWSALPILPTRVLYAGAAIFVLASPVFYLVWVFTGKWPEFLVSVFAHLLTLVGLIAAGLILMAVLLRVIVYFRDNYRASNYGVPDLIQIIRAIDRKVVERRRARGQKDEPDQRVQLSFIGHSMGGFLVTNTIRTLTDVFKHPVEALNHFGADAPPPGRHLKTIGTVFELKRFVLASPDIPAEALLSDRGNFLASSLSRFDEAYLFSNEGDEVLRQISTLANYFVFPTKSRDYGFRLGNVEILSSSFGLIKPAENDFLGTLRVGNLTLQQLYDKLEDAEASRHRIARTKRVPRLPAAFSYFDCTDYVDQNNDGEPGQKLLTFAKCLKHKEGNPKARLSFGSHLQLLYAYVVDHKPNVHGGYFEGLLSQQLIYRLACLGYDATKAAYGGESLLGKACADKQIRVLLSPLLAAGQSVRSETADAVSPAPAARSS
ncbi:MAG TPA: hypothetical protein VN065_20315 [Bradyrhizobium sp.]|nr:hypothetical protein [Bradyrhizobium sp.]